MDVQRLAAALNETAGQSQHKIASRVREFTDSLDAVQSDSISNNLVLQARGGDAQAWDQIVNEYTGLVMHCVADYAVPPADRADIVQDVFRAVYRSIERFDPERTNASFRGWLLETTRNKIRDYLKRRTKEPPAAGGTTNYRQILRAPSPESGSSLDEGFRDVRFKRLMEEMQAEVEHDTWRAFWETTVEERPAPDVAAELGKTPAAVRKAKSRMLHELRRRMTELQD